MALEDTGMTVKVFSGEGQLNEIRLPPPTLDMYNTWNGPPDGSFRGVDYIRLFCVDATVHPPAVHPAVRYYRHGTSRTAMACSSCPCETPETIVMQPPPPPPPMVFISAPNNMQGGGTLATRGSSSLLRFRGVPGVRYLFQCLVDRRSGFTDSLMTLYEAEPDDAGSFTLGRRVKHNDDHRSGVPRVPQFGRQRFGSSFRFRIPYSTSNPNYLIKVAAYGGRQTGDFVVRVIVV